MSIFHKKRRTVRTATKKKSWSGGWLVLADYKGKKMESLFSGTKTQVRGDVHKGWPGARIIRMEKWDD